MGWLFIYVCIKLIIIIGIKDLGLRAWGCGFWVTAKRGVGLPVELPGGCLIDELEQLREGVADVEASPAAVADVKDWQGVLRGLCF